MKTIIDIIHRNNDKIILNPVFINIDELINLVLTDNYYIKINTKNIIYIKDYNAKEKLIIDMFINNFIYFNLVRSKYNKYIYYKIIKLKNTNLINYQPIFSAFYIGIDILYRSNMNRHYKNILQIGILPSYLEGYIKYSNISKIIEKSSNNLNDLNMSFLKINSKKYESKLNNVLYEQLTTKFSNKYKFVNKYTIDTNFSNDIIKNHHYELIIFDIYKHLSDINTNEILSEYNLINPSYFESLLVSKYIFKYILFAIKHLQKNGNLILLFSGYEHKIYDQFIKLLNIFFHKVQLIISPIDFSYRYHVIAHYYKHNPLLEKLNEININNGYMINLFDNIHINNNINISLNNKFKSIYNKIKILESYYDNHKLINKLYDIQWCIQLYKTYKWLSKVLNIQLFKNTKNNIYIYFKNAINKIKKKLDKNIAISYIINLKDKKLNIINTKVDQNELYLIISNLKYIKLFNLIIFTSKYTYNDYIIEYSTKYTKNDLNELINFLNIKDNNIIHMNHIIANKAYKIEKTYFLPNNDVFYLDIDYYLDLNDKTNIMKFNNHIIIIKFNIFNINSFLISLIYIFTLLYEKTLIYYPKNIIQHVYFIGINRNSRNIDKLITFFDANLKTLHKNLVILAFPESFINRINDILYKIIIKQLLLAFRLKTINKLEPIIDLIK